MHVVFENYDHKLLHSLTKLLVSVTIPYSRSQFTLFYILIILFVCLEFFVWFWVWGGFWVGFLWVFWPFVFFPNKRLSKEQLLNMQNEVASRIQKTIMFSSYSLSLIHGCVNTGMPTNYHGIANCSV